MCVLLFVMKIGFQQIDGEFLGETYNLMGPAQNGCSVMVVLSTFQTEGSEMNFSNCNFFSSYVTVNKSSNICWLYVR